MPLAVLFQDTKMEQQKCILQQWNNSQQDRQIRAQTNQKSRVKYSHFILFLSTPLYFLLKFHKF